MHSEEKVKIKSPYCTIHTHLCLAGQTVRERALCVFSFPVFLSAHTGLLMLVMGEAGSTDCLPVLRNSEGVTTHLNIVSDQTPNQMVQPTGPSALLPVMTKHIKGDNKGQLSVLSGWWLFFLCNMDIQWFTTVIV